MSSIPLPALAAHAPEFQDPVQTALSLKGLMQGQQLRQQQIQGAQQDNQLKAQQLKDTQVVTQAFVKNHGDLDKTLQDAANGGASPQALQALQAHALDVKSKSMDILQKQGTIALQQADLSKGAHAAVEAAPAADRPAVYKQQLMGLQQAGVDTSQLPPEYPGDAQFRVLGAAVTGYKQQLENAAKQSETAKNTAQATEATSVANKNNQEMSMGANSAVADAKYRNIVMNQKLNRPVTPEDLAYKAAYEKQKSIVPVTNFNLQNAGATGSGGKPSALATSIANGQMKWQDAVSARTPMAVKQALLGEVKQINPNFNSGDFDVEQGVRKDFTSGPDSQKLQAFNTAITHMGIFRDLAGKLDNTDIKALNQAGNDLGVQFGSDKVTNFNLAKQAFIGEVTRAFDGGGVTMHDREQVEQQISAASSPAQLKGAADTAEKLLRGKRDVLQQQYQTGRQGQANFGDQQKPADSGNYFDQFPKH